MELEDDNLFEDPDTWEILDRLSNSESNDVESDGDNNDKLAGSNVPVAGLVESLSSANLEAGNEGAAMVSSKGQETLVSSGFLKERCSNCTFREASCVCLHCPITYYCSICILMHSKMARYSKHRVVSLELYRSPPEQQKHEHYRRYRLCQNCCDNDAVYKCNWCPEIYSEYCKGCFDAHCRLAAHAKHVWEPLQPMRDAHLLLANPHIQKGMKEVLVNAVKEIAASAINVPPYYLRHELLEAQEIVSGGPRYVVELSIPVVEELLRPIIASLPPDRPLDHWRHLFVDVAPKKRSRTAPALESTPSKLGRSLSFRSDELAKKAMALFVSVVLFANGVLYPVETAEGVVGIPSRIVEEHRDKLVAKIQSLNKLSARGTDRELLSELLKLLSGLPQNPMICSVPLVCSCITMTDTAFTVAPSVEELMTQLTRLGQPNDAVRLEKERVEQCRLNHSDSCSSNDRLRRTFRDHKDALAYANFLLDVIEFRFGSNPERHNMHEYTRLVALFKDQMKSKKKCSLDEITASWLDASETIFQDRILMRTLTGRCLVANDQLVASTRWTDCYCEFFFVKKIPYSTERSDFIVKHAYGVCCNFANLQIYYRHCTDITIPHDAFDASSRKFAPEFGISATKYDSTPWEALPLVTYFVNYKVALDIDGAQGPKVFVLQRCLLEGEGSLEHRSVWYFDDNDQHFHPYLSAFEISIAALACGDSWKGVSSDVSSY